jgi:putative MATE family efflux protein
MNMLTDNVKPLYRKFLFPSMGGALAISIYSLIDTIAVGQYEGPAGAAAMAIIAPMYGLLIFLAILCGIGGSVRMSIAKGGGNEEKGNAYFTAALALMGIITVAAWLLFVLFSESLFTVFGADESTMPMVMLYAKWLVWFLPIFILPTFLGAFIRNDGAPGFALNAILIGGGLNIFGDWLFVFPLDMGIEGAAIATVIGTSVQVLIMCCYFLRKRCGLRLVKPDRMFRAIKKILGIGFGASILDLGAVVLAIILINQIMRYGGYAALAVYGVLATVTSLIQALYAGVGQTIQPLVSSNFGAGLHSRIKSFLRMSLLTVIVMGVFFVGIGELFPVQVIKLFMTTTPEVLGIAPAITRIYFVLFLFLGITILSTYYLQSVMRDKVSMLVAVLRSIVASGLLLFTLPLFLGITGVWLAVPVSEFVVAIIALCYIKRNRLESKKFYQG